MKLFILSLLVIFTLANACGEEEFEPIEKFYHKNVGIKKAAAIKQAEMRSLKKRRTCNIKLKQSPIVNYPYYGGLLITLEGLNRSVCGSVLITYTALVTAAQCWFDGIFQAIHFEVVLGSPTLYYGGIRMVTNRVTVNPNFDYETHQADIAVIRVDHFLALPHENIMPIYFPNEEYVEEKELNDKLLETVGYSLIGRPEFNTLTAAAVLKISNKECAKTYGNEIIADDVICVQAVIAGGPCKADYGSPLTIEIYGHVMVLGINSFVVNRGCETWPPVGFMSTLYYQGWIETLIRDTFH